MTDPAQRARPAEDDPARWYDGGVINTADLRKMARGGATFAGQDIFDFADSIDRLREQVGTLTAERDRAVVRIAQEMTEKDVAVSELLDAQAAVQRVRDLCDRHAVTHQITPAWITAVRKELAG